MTSLVDLSEDIEKIIRDYTGFTTYNVNAVVHNFERNMNSEEWTPENRSYKYRSLIILHIPYYSSANGRPDTYSYDVLYKKDKDGNVVNIAKYYKECEKKNKRRRDRKKEVPLDEVKKMVVQDNERRKTLTKSYAEDLLDRVNDYTYYNGKEIVKKVNGEREKDELQIEFVSSDPYDITSLDGNARTLDIQLEVVSNNMVVKEGKDDDVMEEFKVLVAKGMNIMCGELFAHSIKQLKEENVNEKKDMFVIPGSLATGNFWSNLLDRIKFTKKKLTYRLTNTDRSRFMSRNYNNAEWWEAWKEEYNTRISGAIRKRPKICRKDHKRTHQKVMFEPTYIVEQKFQLVANTTYLLSKGSRWRMPNMLPELKF